MKISNPSLDWNVRSLNSKLVFTKTIFSRRWGRSCEKKLFVCLFVTGSKVKKTSISTKSFTMTYKGLNMVGL